MINERNKTALKMDLLAYINEATKHYEETPPPYDEKVYTEKGPTVGWVPLERILRDVKEEGTPEEVKAKVMEALGELAQQRPRIVHSDSEMWRRVATLETRVYKAYGDAEEPPAVAKILKIINKDGGSKAKKADVESVNGWYSIMYM